MKLLLHLHLYCSIEIVYIIQTSWDLLFGSLFIVDGEWSPWTTWSSCSATCGDGTRERSRQCDNPPPSLGGNDCAGSDSEVDNCNKEPCPGKPLSKLSALMYQASHMVDFLNHT